MLFKFNDSTLLASFKTKLCIVIHTDNSDTVRIYIPALTLKNRFYLVTLAWLYEYATLISSCE